MHFMIFMRARADRDASAFQDWYLKDHAPRLQKRGPDLVRHCVNLTTEGPPELRLAHDSSDPRARYDVIAQMWCDTVAGFQGLMRIQDALVRIRGVREAGVEAYAQGEARLRLHLSAAMDAVSLAAALTELLGRPTRVAASSTTEHTLQLVLE